MIVVVLSQKSIFCSGAGYGLALECTVVTRTSTSPGTCWAVQGVAIYNNRSVSFEPHQLMFPFLVVHQSGQEMAGPSVRRCVCAH